MDPGSTSLPNTRQGKFPHVTTPMLRNPEWREALYEQLCYHALVRRSDHAHVNVLGACVQSLSGENPPALFHWIVITRSWHHVTCQSEHRALVERARSRRAPYGPPSRPPLPDDIRNARLNEIREKLRPFLKRERCARRWP